MPVQGVLAALHDGEDFLFLQSPTHDLYAYGETGHLCCVVVLVRALSDAVEGLEIEGCGEGIGGGVDVGYGDDAGGVVELC